MIKLPEVISMDTLLQKPGTLKRRGPHRVRTSKVGNNKDKDRDKRQEKERRFKSQNQHLKCYGQ